MKVIAQSTCGTWGLLTGWKCVTKVPEQDRAGAIAEEIMADISFQKGKKKDIALVTFLIAMMKYLTYTTYRRKDLFWLMVSGASVHSPGPMLRCNIMAVGTSGRHLLTS
jgi:hypothetical protein